MKIYATLKTFPYGKFAGLLVYYFSPKQDDGAIPVEEFLKSNEITSNTLIAIDLTSLGDGLDAVSDFLRITAQFGQNLIVVHNTTKVHPLFTGLKAYFIHHTKDVEWNGQPANEVHVQITENKFRLFPYYTPSPVYVDFKVQVDDDVVLQYLKANYHLEFLTSRIWKGVPKGMKKKVDFVPEDIEKAVESFEATLPANQPKPSRLRGRK